MGAEQIGDFSTDYRPDTLTLDELERLSQHGIEVSFDEITRLDDGTLGYKDSRVLVYIRDVSTYGGQVELPKFHAAYCSTLEKMKESNRFERYVVATREDGSFQINKIENGRKRGSSWESLTICQNCLNALSFDSFSYRLQSKRRREIVRDFTIARFFEQFPKTLHLRRPRHDYISAPVNEYSPGFSEAAKGYKAQRDWKCDKCGLDFSGPTERRFLHVHHKNGLKYDDTPDNWRALCLGCHAEEPQHTHMTRPDNFKEFQKKYEHLRSAALRNRR